jgi:hypothetical protein
MLFASFLSPATSHPLFVFGRNTATSRLVALVFGTILNLINQGDAIFGAASINWTKIVLTYLVPYAVSTYGAVSYLMSRPPT